MPSRGLVIFDAFNTLVTSRRGSKRTFLAGLAQAGLDCSRAMLLELQVASEGLDHSGWSGSRPAYCDWAAETLAAVAQTGGDLHASLASHVAPALEQWHQAAVVALPGAADCLTELRRAGFTIAVCSNWGWDLAADMAAAGLAASIDVFVPSAQAGYRKPHPRIYHDTLERARLARTTLSSSVTACGPTSWAATHRHPPGARGRASHGPDRSRGWPRSPRCRSHARHEPSWISRPGQRKRVALAWTACCGPLALCRAGGQDGGGCGGEHGRAGELHHQ